MSSSQNRGNATSYQTFLRYLFSSESHGYLTKSEANYAIAETCLKYLSSDCFDSELSDEVVNEGILLGAYVLQDCAASHWLEHILRGSTALKTSICLEDISRNIEKMIELRKNWTCEGSYTGRAPVNGLMLFEEQAPEVFEMLLHIHSFLRRRWREFSLDDGEAACKSIRLNALTLSFSRRIVGE